tara:strand:+ start:7353 stop:9458 length:2106 start_codon:yes stop_codon:yes gene_type:complete
MALTLSAEFTKNLSNNSDIYPIISIAGSSTIYLSTRDVTVDGTDYDGRLLSAPSITSNISFRNFEARTNNVTLRIANNGYEGTFGQRTNKEVIIYFATDNTTDDIAHCLKVFTGRVRSIIKLTSTEIAVECEDFAAWRYNKVLQEQITFTAGYNMIGVSKYRPLHYGDFVENSSSESTPGFCDSKKLRPVDYISQDRDYLYYDEGINDTGARPHIYIDGIDHFVPIEQAQTNSHSKFGTNTIRVDNDDNPASNKSYFRYTIRLYPNTSASTGDVSAANLTVNSITNVIDNDTGTSVTCTANASGGGTVRSGVFGEYSGSLLGSIKTVKASIRGTSTEGANVYVWIKSGDGTTILNETVTTANSWSQQLSSSVLTSTKDVSSVYASNGSGVNFNGLIFGFYQQASGNIRAIVVQEMYLDFTCFIPIDESSSKSKDQEIPQRLYIGTDGTSLDNSGVYDTDLTDHGPTEVHENILTNLGPGSSAIDNTTQAAVEGNFDSNGLTRCSITDPNMTVQDALLKLQKEAGFISYVKPSDGKVYYLIEDGTSKSIDVDLLTSDYKNIQFGTIPLSDMLWKARINYDKHPEKNTYLTGSTTQDTTEKSNYDFGDNDNTYIQNNDWVNEPEVAVNLIGLFKFQRMTVQCEILNQRHYTLEIGDVVTFSDSPIDFRLRDSSASYTDYQFRIMETTRTVYSLKIKAMEVHKA